MQDVMSRVHQRLPIALGLALLACGDPAGEGTASFSTWGEAYIEQ